MKTEFTIKHSTYMMTIAELIDAIEQITEAKVKQISESGDMLTFKIEWPEPEVKWRYEEPECRGCGGEGPLNDGGYCSHCLADMLS